MAALFGGPTLLSSERRGGRDGRDSWDSKDGLIVIDTGLLLDLEDSEYAAAIGVGVGFGLALESSQAIADFSEPKSSSDIWGEFV